MATLKNLIGKTCDISLLKGITHESFSRQNKIYLSNFEEWTTAKNAFRFEEIEIMK